jgi:hypothetical protein
VRKIAVKRLIRDEKGQTLILVLILLAVGALIIAPLLNYMGTGLISGEVYDKKTDELYAADAGAEDAVWKIQNQVDEVYYLYCGQGNHTLSYNITDVNGKSVAVTIAYVDSKTYRVESTATGDGSGTEIDAYITGKSRYGDFSGMLNHVVTTQGIIDEQGKVYLNPPSGPSGPVENYTGDWPTAEDLEGFYGQNLTGAQHYYSDTTIDLEGNSTTLGPLYVAGKLTIKNSDNSKTPTLTLTGTIYVTGDTQIGYGTSQNFHMTLNLNGNAIFVASNSTGSGSEALKIGDNCDIEGLGVIVAIGDIYFKPKSQIATDPVFVLSALGTTRLQPQGDIYGAVAGSVEVGLQPGTSITYPAGGFGSSDLNFPTGIQYLVYSIASWEVIPL